MNVNNEWKRSTRECMWTLVLVVSQ